MEYSSLVVMETGLDSCGNSIGGCLSSCFKF